MHAQKLYEQTRHRVLVWKFDFVKHMYSKLLWHQQVIWYREVVLVVPSTQCSQYLFQI